MKLIPDDAGPVVRAFYWFSVIAVAIQVLTLLSPLRGLQALVVPFTGWIMGAPYLFALTNVTRPELYGGWRRSLVHAAVVCVIYAVFGIATFVYLGGPTDDENPWLRISIWQPVWTCLIPLAWATALARESRRAPAARQFRGSDHHFGA